MNKLQAKTTTNTIHLFKLKCLTAKINQKKKKQNIKDIADLEREIEDIKITLDSDRRIKNLISKQLQEISKKYGKDRVTEVISAEENKIDFVPEKFIDDFSLKIFVTRQRLQLW